MKHNISQQVEELSLMEVSSFDVEAVFDGTPKDVLNNLELTMTNSAFGYEYALKALEEEGELSAKSEHFRIEIEAFKDAYFEARQRMTKLDPNYLEKFEQALKVEKSIVFSKTEYLH